MLIAGGRIQEKDPDAALREARKMLLHSIESGSALEKLEELVKAQGGDGRAVYDTSLLPKASVVVEVKAPSQGWITQIACDEIGMCSLILGGGRETKKSTVDLSAGLLLKKKTGDFCQAGETLAQLHTNDPRKAEAARERFLNAYVIEEERPSEKKPALIKGIL